MWKRPKASKGGHPEWLPLEGGSGKQQGRTPLHCFHGLAEKARTADCIASAQRYFDFVCDWRAAAAGGGYEMVLRRGARGGTATGWGLLAHGVGGGYCGAAADAGDWVGAVQTGDGREIAGATTQFFGHESAVARRCLCGHSVVGRNCGASRAGGGADSEDAFGICSDCALGTENEAARASILRGLAESAD